jgi:tetratricopeptide (TPR) repeat protein
MDFEYTGLKWRAMACLMLGMNQRAESLFGDMLALAPGDAYALASRAHVRGQLGRKTAAIADLRALVAAHPERNAADHYNLAFLLEEEAATAQAPQLEEAETHFRRALALNEKLDPAWYGLGLVLIRQHRLDEAVAALKRNTELQPMSPYGWYQLARVQIDRNKPDEAKKIIKHLKGFEPKVAEQLVRETGLAAD